MGKPKTEKAKGTTKRRGVKLQPTELVPTEIAIDAPSGELAELADQVKRDGGTVLAYYREPLGGNSLCLVALPVEKIEPTPYQREVSDAHVRKLTVAMDKIVFHQPVFVGDVLSLYAEAEKVGRTSMTIKVRVCARRRDEPGTTVNVTEAEVVFVALGPDSKPAPIFD